MGRCLVLVWLAIGVCAVGPVGVARGQAQAISTRIVAEFGGPTDDIASEMVRVLDVARADDGRFIVATARPYEIRVYDGAGRLVRRLGREGGGPGEHQGAPVVRHWPGDSVLAYSPGRRVWMLYRLDGRLVREWPYAAEDGRLGDAALIGSAFTQRQFSAIAYCRATLIRQAAPGGGPVHEAFVDGAGRVLLRRAGATSWRVLAASGAALGVVTLPVDFTVTQATGSAIVGYRLDADGFPHVMAIEPALPAGAPLAPCASPDDSPRAADVRAQARNTVTAAEAFFSDAGRYPRNMGEMRRRLPEGLSGTFDLNGERNYTVTVVEDATGFRCVLSMGGVSGLPSVVAVCGR